ncbi:MAG: ankyrin repeat domain-containing protein [Acidobacteria bacterium]|nr:ankyrin repeat domain-containing protein [Acidobacteriota bacterium]
MGCFGAAGPDGTRPRALKSSCLVIDPRTAPTGPTAKMPICRTAASCSWVRPTRALQSSPSRMRIGFCGVAAVCLALPPVAGAAAGADPEIANAVRHSDTEAVRSLLQRRADVNAAQSDGATALHWAAHWNDLDTADLLIRAGAHVNVTNNYGVAPLSLACVNRSAAMVDRLLKAGASAKTVNARTGQTALMECARTGTVAAVKSLLAGGADANAKEARGGQTALMWAVASRQPDTVRALVAGGADVRVRSAGGFTPLLFAAQQGDIESARILLAAGADANERTPAEGGPKGLPLPDGGRSGLGVHMSPLLIAADSGHEAFSIFLLEQGADPNAADGMGVTALHYALMKGFTTLRGGGPRIFLYHLYRPNMPALVKALLARGARPNAQLVKEPAFIRGINGDSRSYSVGATPFMLAAVSSDTESMRILAAGGADTNLPTTDGNTPLIMVAGLRRTPEGFGRAVDATAATQVEEERKALDAVALAVELGADVHAANADGQTALHGAALKGSNDIVRFLVSKGATLEVKDKAGFTPWATAAGVPPPGFKGRINPSRIHKDTADLLLTLGATATTPTAP